MHTIEIPDRDILIELPEHWDECTPDQRDYILSELGNTVQGKQSIYDFRTRVFVRLSGLRLTANHIVRNRKGLADTVNERIALLSEKLCSWPFSQNEDHFEPNYDSVVNPYPTLTYKKHSLQGPADLLQDLTFYQFRTALSDISELTRHQTPELLHQFIRNLYNAQPAANGQQPTANSQKPTANSQQPITDEILQNTPLYKLQSILLWFTFCIRTIQTTPLEIQGTEIDFSVLFPQDTPTEEGTSPQTFNNLGWTALLFDISESGVFGDSQSTDSTNIYTILMFLIKKHQDNQKAKRKT